MPEASRETNDSGPRELYGALAEFGSPAELVAGCRAVRQAGYVHWDAHTPFPVHGLEKAMGLEASPIGWFVLVFGLAGAGLGLLLQWWTSAVAYPLVVSGKPLFSWPAFVPILFECGVLGGALGAVLGFLWSSRLPQPHHALFESEGFGAVTDDKFFLSIEARDPLFEAEGTRQLLTGLGASRVELIEVPQ